MKKNKKFIFAFVYKKVEEDKKFSRQFDSKIKIDHCGVLYVTGGNRKKRAFVVVAFTQNNFLKRNFQLRLLCKEEEEAEAFLSFFLLTGRKYTRNFFIL